ncbi:MAG: hypothetical protein M1833_006692 [Piccolia ochrophora]|nr:MAG: hypothetical protein M1833_006692 [Piccolia ochrophora]
MHAIPDDSPNTSDSVGKEYTNVTEETGPTVEGAETGGPTPPTRDRTSNYGSAVRRSTRNKKPRDIPPVDFPEWFLRRNIRIHGSQTCPVETLALYDEGSALPTQRPGIPNVEEQQSPTTVTPDTERSQSIKPEARYYLHTSLWNEILATVRTGLSLPTPAYADSFPAWKSHALLQCPKDGGIYFLDSIVEKVVSSVGADLIKLDAQDIAEIGGDYLGDGPQPSQNSIRSLGYNAYQASAKQDSREMEEEADEEDSMEQEEEDEGMPTQRTNQSPFSIARISAVPVGRLHGRLEDIQKSAKALFGAVPDLRDMRVDRYGARSQSPYPEQWEDARLAGLAGAIFESRALVANEENALSEDDKESKKGTPQPDPTVALPNGTARPLVLVIQDYKEISSSSFGGPLIEKLHDQVRALRKAGQRVMMVGTVASEDLTPSISRSGFRGLQAEHDDGPGRTIVVTPPRGAEHDRIFAADEGRRLREINMRHLQDVFRQRIWDHAKASSVLARIDLRLDSTQEYSSGLEDSVWSFDQVHRLAVTALGLLGPEDELTVETIGKAVQLIDSSDEVKFQWATEERQEQKSLEESSESGQKTPTSQPRSTMDSESRMKRIRKTCNTYEKKLLGGVVNPGMISLTHMVFFHLIEAENIRTTFSDVHAPAETVEALKTLTSLSLIRPEAFSYGVLASDKIPGLLLYGPPGTGKTLLAKAVAKESGATVLEVSGSEVYDMYVGEGEKNVKAIFTLAKKLSPCVVFVDEADAIFGSRGGHANRTSHRELINQFLREWDGMNDLSAFIMVATNRPFDLDDAVLRRLPRRLLVDLPIEKDREAILNIHLKGEALDSAVSLSGLAQKTPFYSGSDLKNLCVAAALACVREENDDAAKHKAGTDATPHQYPERRTLAERHFDRAIEEISASISEDMSSLTAIKKFDEKYGDRKGRRKKRGWGFGGAEDKETRTETERVRR